MRGVAVGAAGCIVVLDEERTDRNDVHLVLLLQLMLADGQDDCLTDEGFSFDFRRTVSRVDLHLHGRPLSGLRKEKNKKPCAELSRAHKKIKPWIRRPAKASAGRSQFPSPRRSLQNAPPCCYPPSRSSNRPA